MPPLPSSIDELNFEAEWSKTFNGEEFMLGSRDCVFMFLTHNNLALIAEAPTLYMDGTFVYFLLPGKTRAAYNTNFMPLKETAQNLGLQVEPRNVLTEFEVALQQSVTNCFPQAERKGCYFHYTQAIWRKVQTLELQ